MNSINNKNKQKKKFIKRKIKIKGKRLPNNRKKRTNIIRGRKIAAASAKTFSKKFTMLRQNGNSVRVTGRDLIYSIPDDLTSPIQDTSVITVIPANPAYWKGTRIAALASGYQNYRPILFKITYIPMCAVTQQGNVIGGTIWDDGIDNANLQQSLRTSNGGFLTQCYVPHTTRIRPKSNLQFNLYRMGGEFSTTSNPFVFIALAIGCKNANDQRIIPGYFYVTWSFELKNPIGSINSYNNSGLIEYDNIVPELNTTLINLDINSEIPFGAYINVEQEDDKLIPYYNDTPIEINSNTPTWCFSSVAKTTNTKSIQKIPIVYTGITTTDFRVRNNDGYIGFIDVKDDFYDIFIVASVIYNNNDYRVPNSDSVLLLSDKYQNFGDRDSDITITCDVYENDEKTGTVQILFTRYKASKNNYITQLFQHKKNNKNFVPTTRYIQPVPLIEDQIDKSTKAISECKISTSE